MRLFNCHKKISSIRCSLYWSLKENYVVVNFMFIVRINTYFLGSSFVMISTISTYFIKPFTIIFTSLHKPCTMFYKTQSKI